MTELLLVASVVLNVLLAWYIIVLLRKYLPISQDLEDLFDFLAEYHFHIKTVSEMESFYGEPILLNLLRHSKAVAEEVDNFRAAYSLLDEEEEEPLELEEGEETDGDQEEDDLTDREHEVLGVVHNTR